MLIAIAAILVSMLFPAPLPPVIYNITTCTDSQLNRVLARAVDGSVIRFVCDGRIFVANTKIIGKNLTFDAVGHNVTLDGRRTIPVLDVQAGVKVTLNHVTIANGAARIGGGAVNNVGTLTITNSRLINNNHAIANFGVLLVFNSTFTTNRGDGIYNQQQIVVINSSFSDNVRGIDNANGTALVIGSAFTRNTAVEADSIGAGIANSGALTVIHSSFTDNQATYGGGLGNHRGGRVILIGTVLANNRFYGNCAGPMIDGGYNAQDFNSSCSGTIPTLQLVPSP